MTLKVETRPLDIESSSLRPEGPDARDFVPDVRDEALQAIQDLIQKKPPSTVLGVLLDRQKPMELFTIAGLIDRPATEVEWTIEVLADEGYLHVYEEGGLKMIKLAEEWTSKE